MLSNTFVHALAGFFLISLCSLYHVFTLYILSAPQRHTLCLDVSLHGMRQLSQAVS
eukprot:m.172051 g.172051  ORF g.172051 m.172051 type:complete len:56 (-) comp14569_c0_seq2:1884-2051(-)